MKKKQKSCLLWLKQVSKNSKSKYFGEKFISCAQLHSSDGINVFMTDEKKMEIGGKVKVPFLDKEADIISIKGKNCIAQLEMLGAIVSFQLS